MSPSLPASESIRKVFPTWATRRARVNLGILARTRQTANPVLARQNQEDDSYKGMAKRRLSLASLAGESVARSTLVGRGGKPLAGLRALRPVWEAITRRKTSEAGCRRAQRLVLRVRSAAKTFWKTMPPKPCCPQSSLNCRDARKPEQGSPPSRPQDPTAWRTWNTCIPSLNWSAAKDQLLMTVIFPLTGLRLTTARLSYSTRSRRWSTNSGLLLLSERGKHSTESCTGGESRSRTRPVTA